MSVEALKSLFDVLTVVLLGFTFLAGAGVLITGNIINKRQSEQLKAFDSDMTKAKSELATQQERAAKAEGNIVLAEQHAAEANAKAEGFRLDIANANERAGKAQASLALAEQHAAEANTKAEGFRLDIAKANQASSEAQAQVAGATAEAAKANLELERIRTPRSLTNASGLTDSLKMFKGTEYVFIGCFQDQDSINLLIQLDKALADAGWTRGKLPPQNSFGDIQLNISKDFAVPITSRSGVYVGAQTTETVDALKAIPVPQLPEYLRAAMALKGGLASGITPSEGDLGPLPVDPGNSTSVFILIGKKP